MKFVQLIFRKIIIIVATRCHILKLKCVKFGCGSAPDSAGGSYSARPDSLGLKGSTSEGRRREWRRGEGG